MGSSPSYLSPIMSEFEHDCTLQETHITEYFNPAFLQLQVAVMQPLRHLHDTMLSKSGGAGFLSVVIGTSPFIVTLQPHCVGGKSLLHFVICT